MVFIPQFESCLITSTISTKLSHFSTLIHVGLALKVRTRFPSIDFSAIRIPRAIAAFMGSPSIDPDTSTIAIILPSAPVCSELLVHCAFKICASGPFFLLYVIILSASLVKSLRPIRFPLILTSFLDALAAYSVNFSAHLIRSSNTDLCSPFFFRFKNACFCLCIVIDVCFSGTRFIH